MNHKEILQRLQDASVFQTAILVLVFLGPALYVADTALVQKSSAELDVRAQFVAGQKDGNISVGLNIEDNLDYGRMPLYIKATKHINLSSPDFTRARVESTGNISQFLNHTKTVKFRGTREIDLTINGTKTGNYTGSLNIKTVSAENKLGEKWINLVY